MRLGSKNYKLLITIAVWKICCISLNPNMILAHDEALKISPAIYPFWRSDLKSFCVAKGSLNFMTDNIYHSVVVECEFWNRFPKAEIRRKTGYV